MNDSVPNIRNSYGKLTEVRNIYCVGRNFLSHAEELNNPVSDNPVIFQKSISALTTSDEIIIPTHTDIQHELEVVVLIHSSGYQIKAENAMNYVAGYGLGLDLTDRKMQNELKSNQLPWFLSKNFRNSAVVSDFKHWDDPIWNNPFWLEKNGEKVQEGKISDMIFSVEFLIEFLSNRIPLMAGDILFTGTPHGVGPIESGDELKLGLGDDIFKIIQVNLF